MRVSVQDTGCGIPKEKMGALFQKFSQADSSTTRKYGGTGFGLAISKQLIELMGGSIGVRSTLGEGSTFWFTLPLELDTHPHAAPVPVADLRGLRAMIVDDNEMNRRVLHEQISSWGMRNGSFSSGDKVLDTLRAAKQSGDPYLFVLLDYQMPGMANSSACACRVKGQATAAAAGFLPKPAAPCRKKTTACDYAGPIPCQSGDCGGSEGENET